jgi:hypothetical protein
MRWQINLICAAVGHGSRRNLGDPNGGSARSSEPAAVT